MVTPQTTIMATRDDIRTARNDVALLWEGGGGDCSLPRRRFIVPVTTLLAGK